VFLCDPVERGRRQAASIAARKLPYRELLKGSLNRAGFFWGPPTLARPEVGAPYLARPSRTSRAVASDGRGSVVHSLEIGEVAVAPLTTPRPVLATNRIIRRL